MELLIIGLALSYLAIGAWFVVFALVEQYRVDPEFQFDMPRDLIVVLVGLIVWPLILWDEIKQGLGK